MVNGNSQIYEIKATFVYNPDMKSSKLIAIISKDYLDLLKSLSFILVFYLETTKAFYLEYLSSSSG